MVVPSSAPAAICRPGRDDDRQYMIELAGKTFVDFGDYRAIIDQWLDAPRVGSLLLVQDGVRQGFALVALSRGIGFWRSVSAELVAIALEPDVHRRGLGTLLLSAAEDGARRCEAQEMRLHTANENRIAQAFFTSAGYRLREGRATYYPNGQSALEFRRALR